MEIWRQLLIVALLGVGSWFSGALGITLSDYRFKWRTIWETVYGLSTLVTPFVFLASMIALVIEE